MTEARIQQDIVRHYRNNFCLRHHTPRSLILSIPNEFKPHLVHTGLYAGGADLLVLHVRIELRILFIEVKTPTGTVSDKQRKFEQHINGMAIFVNNNNVSLEYHVVRSLEDFKKIINNGN